MSISFERIADRYDETRGGEERGEQLAELLQPHFSARGRTLEVGVGTGLVALALQRAGRQVVGVDLAPAMLRRARQRIGNRVVVGDAAQLPFLDGSFADAYAVWVLHVVADQPALFREAVRVLRPGGRLLVVVGWPEADEINQVVLDLADRFDPGRNARDDPDRLRGAAESAGLQPRPSPPPLARTYLESPAASRSGRPRPSGTWTKRSGGRSCRLSWSASAPWAPTRSNAPRSTNSSSSRPRSGAGCRGGRDGSDGACERNTKSTKGTKRHEGLIKN
jgi:SAM-dependent methyltransferase